MKTENEIQEEISQLTKDATKEKNYHLRSYIFREIDILRWVLED